MDTATLTEFFQKFLSVWPVVVTIASGIATVTPTKADNAAIAFLRTLVDWLALNVGNAKPAKDPDAIQTKPRSKQ